MEDVTDQEAEMYIPIPLACLKASEVSRLKVGHKPIAFQACAEHCLFGTLIFLLFFLPLVSKQHGLYPPPLTQPVSANRSCTVFKTSATGHCPWVTKWQLRTHYSP